MKSTRQSTTKRAKALRAMRKNETKKEKAARLAKRRERLAQYKRAHTREAKHRAEARDARDSQLPDGHLFLIEDSATLAPAAQATYETLARAIKHLMHVHNGLMRFTAPELVEMRLGLERTIDAKLETLNAFLEYAPDAKRGKAKNVA